MNRNEKDSSGVHSRERIMGGFDSKHESVPASQKQLVQKPGDVQLNNESTRNLINQKQKVGEGIEQS
jgi:hypothetical protein